ncbi:putative Histidine kinase [Rubrivivax sp. A210]|uniref:ATP-binding protein n=1 Tax=Rubrivivax sp. A210 TaxID=2772301 RepID=UPI00191AED32|nr:ATP-binding protein [Rubrivivax sp. A210]CAD5369759.1 putative Histidine kinase [Rubrivivax sp. A210]
MITLGRKVLAASLAALLLLGGLYVLVTGELDAWNEASAYVMRDYQRAILDGELNAGLARASGELASFALTGEAQYRDEAAEALRRAEAAVLLLRKIRHSEPLGEGDSDHAIYLRRQQTVLRSSQETLASVAAAAAGAGSAPLGPAALGRIYEHEAEADSLWREIRQHHDGEVSENIATLYAHSHRAHVIFLIGVVLCTAACAAAFVYVRRRVVKPLTGLAALTRTVAAGDLTPRAQVTQSDEIGQLQRSFNQMLVELDLQRRQLTEAIESLHVSREAAEQANRAKSDFLANVSHELRTPMNGVLVSLDLMHEMAANGEQRELADMARGSARRLLVMLNDLLSFSRIEAGQIELQAVAFDPRALVTQMVELHGVRATAKGVTVACALAPDVPARVSGDPVRLGQVLLNLLDNAIKYTDHGRIDVRVSVVERPTSPSPLQRVGLRFEVQDSGIGIPPEAAQKIFQPFFQVDAQGVQGREGMGLGLGIARQLVQRMGGEMGFDSRPGEGSTFWFAVDLAPAAEAAPVVAPAATLALPAGKAVLLAEDHRNTREVMSRMLERRGLRVFAAENGRIALDLARSEVLDLILMDCRMAEMDGFEATHAIRALGDERARVPIVALTAFGLTGSKQDFLDAGFDDLVNKPYSLEDIEAMLQRWLVRGGKA